MRDLLYNHEKSRERLENSSTIMKILIFLLLVVWTYHWKRVFLDVHFVLQFSLVPLPFDLDPDYVTLSINGSKEAKIKSNGVENTPKTLKKEEKRGQEVMRTRKGQNGVKRGQTYNTSWIREHMMI